MKKCILITAIVMLFTMNVNAQLKFFDLIDSFDWTETESDVITKYSDYVKLRKHFYSAHDETMTDYKLENVLFGDLESSADISVDSISREIHSLGFGFNEIESKLDAKALSEKMDNILFPLFGEPDKRSDEWGAVSSMNNADRTWFKEKYVVQVRHMIFKDSHFYHIQVKGIKNTGNDFRVAKWGDSKQSIIEKEGKTNLSTDDRIYLFSDIVAGMTCDVAYIFTDNILTMAKYMFNTKHTNKNDYIEDYAKLVALMVDKYGEPGYDVIEWRNSLYKNDIEDHGFAVSLGHVSYNAGWLGQTTTISVALYGENHKINLMVQYISEKYKNFRDKQQIQDKIKDL